MCDPACSDVDALEQLGRHCPVFSSVFPILFVKVSADGRGGNGFVRYGHRTLLDAVRPHVVGRAVDVYYWDSVVGDNCKVTAETTGVHMLYWNPLHARVVVCVTCGV